MDESIRRAESALRGWVAGDTPKLSTRATAGRRRAGVLLAALILAVLSTGPSAPHLGAFETSIWNDDNPWSAPPPEGPHEFLREGSVIVPIPEPFSLNAYDAVQAIWMIRRAGLLQRKTDHPNRPEIVPVREVRGVFVGEDDEAPVPFERRSYDLLLNGEPLDWDRLYIKYGGRMVSLRALFTYRNQHPQTPPAYRLPGPR